MTSILTIPKLCRAHTPTSQGVRTGLLPESRLCITRLTNLSTPFLPKPCLAWPRCLSSLDTYTYNARTHAQAEKESAEKQLKELMARFKLRKALLHWRHRKLTLSFRCGIVQRYPNKAVA